MKRNHLIVYVAGILCVLVIAMPADRAPADNTYFQVPTGNWATNTNWSIGEPDADDDAWVGSSYASPTTVTISLRGEVCKRLWLGTSNGQHGEVSMVGGGLNTDHTMVGVWGEGIFTQSAGPHLVNNDLVVGGYVGSEGEYLLSGDSTTLDVVGSVYVGDHGMGTFKQYGGTHEIGGDLRLADKSEPLGGMYELYGGTLEVGGGMVLANGSWGQLYILGPATATVQGDVSLAPTAANVADVWLTDGTLTVNGNITDGPGASYLRINGWSALHFNGTTIDVDELLIGTDGYAGSHVTNAGESITCKRVRIGSDGSGSLSLQSGASLHCTNDSHLGYAAGSLGSLFVYDGGSLSADSNLYVGYAGRGSVEQYSGGITVGADLYLGREANSSGYWHLAVGTLTVGHDLYLGGTQSAPGGGADMLIESGTTLVVGNGLYVWPDARLNITGGTLTLDAANGLHVKGGEFNFYTGTVEVATWAFLTHDFLTDVLGPARALRNGQHLLCSGTATTLEAELVIDGGTFSARTLNNAGALRFERGRFNKLVDDLVVGSTGTFGPVLNVRDEHHYHAEANVRIHSDGLLRMEGGGLSSEAGSIFVLGRLGGSGQVQGLLNVYPGGEVRVEQGDTLEFLSPGGSVNAGQIFVAGGTLSTAGAFTNAAAGDLFGRGTFITAGLTNDGDAAFSNGVTDVRGDVTNNGRIIVSGRADVTFWDDVHNAGTLFKVAADSSATFFGELTGAGITGGGHVYAEADVMPGASPAAMAFGGDLSFGPLARLHTELGGTTAGSEFDQVNVAGSAALDGTLDISLIAGFAPELADEFRILTFASRTGEFPAVEGWRAGGLALVPLYGA
ncbi:MAG: autotransporter outer membrane beta-barrel domain-containing protein, partial [Planctomycetota bacterium]